MFVFIFFVIMIIFRSGSRSSRDDSSSVMMIIIVMIIIMIFIFVMFITMIFLEQGVSGFGQFRNTMGQQVDEDSCNDDTNGNTSEKFHGDLNTTVFFLAGFFIIILGRRKVGDQVGSDSTEPASNENDED